MHYRTYSDILDNIEGLAGVDAFTTSEQTKILAFVNRRLYQAYAASPSWPRYQGFGARPANDGLIARSYSGAAKVVSSATRSGTTVTVVCTAGVDFVAGMDVTVASLTYSTENPNGTVEVTSVSTTTIDDDTFTYELDDGTGTETYGGTGSVTPVAIPDIEDFHRIWAGNPQKNESARPISGYYEDVDGIHLNGEREGLEGYYVSFKKEWDGPYLSDEDEIPAEFFFYVCHAGYADFLRMDGQLDKALAEESAAEVYLQLELLKPTNSKNSNRLYSTITTHNSTQAR